MGAVKVDRTRPKPRVGIIGEFWAMTTEGDGNYGLQRFLEAEGAEPDIQLVTAWLLYMIWQGRYDTEQRADLRGTDKAKDEQGGSKFSLEGVDVRKRMASLWAGEKVLRGLFQSVRARRWASTTTTCRTWTRSPRSATRSTTTTSAAAKATWRSAS